MKKAIAQILLDEGYIKAFEIVENGTQGLHVQEGHDGPNAVVHLKGDAVSEIACIDHGDVPPQIVVLLIWIKALKLYQVFGRGDRVDVAAFGHDDRVFAGMADSAGLPSVP